MYISSISKTTTSGIAYKWDVIKNLAVNVEDNKMRKFRFVLDKALSFITNSDME